MFGLYCEACHGLALKVCWHDGIAGRKRLHFSAERVLGLVLKVWRAGRSGGVVQPWPHGTPRVSGRSSFALSRLIAPQNGLRDEIEDAYVLGVRPELGMSGRAAYRALAV